MVILSKIQFKYAIMLDLALLGLLLVTQSLLHETSHALAVIMLGGKVDTITVNTFAAEESYVAYQIVYSDYAELYQAFIKLLPHVLLGIIGFYLAHTGINRLKLAGREVVDKYTNLSMGLLYLGSGIWWFLPLRYLVLRSSLQFDIPQAALHLANFAYLHFPERASFFNNLPLESQMRLLIFGLLGLSGLIYGALWLALEGSRNVVSLPRGAAVDFEKGHWEGKPDATLFGQ